MKYKPIVIYNDFLQKSTLACGNPYCGEPFNPFILKDGICPECGCEIEKDDEE